MKPDELIDSVLTAHESGNSELVDLGHDLQLEPKLNYTGKMAREAFLLGMKYLNIGHKYAGLFDFRIIFKSKPVRHKPDIILPAVSRLPIEAVRHVHQGFDPIGYKKLGDEQIALLCCIQAAFAEQEINWGEEIFQQRTYFGRNDIEQAALRESAPRDYQMVYIERCAAQVSLTGGTAQDVVNDVATLVKTIKSGENVRLPIRTRRPKSESTVEPEFEPYLPSVLNGKPTGKWITNHITRAMAFVNRSQENPFYREP